MADAALIETIRIRAGIAPLRALHASRLTSSARALGFPEITLDLPSGAVDGALRLEYDGRSVRWKSRAVGGVEPVRLVVAAVAHEGYPHKTTAREPFDRALDEARAAGADDAVLLTVDGWVAEAAIWGIYWWEGERLAAPPEALGILPSVARRRIAEIAGPLLELRVRPDHLVTRAPFVANALRGIVRVASLDGVLLCADDAADRRVGALADLFWP